MSIALSLSLVVFNSILMIQNLRVGLAFNFILAIVFSNDRLAGLVISYELLAFPPLALVWLYLCSQKPIVIPAPSILIGSSIFPLMLTSWLSRGRYNAAHSVLRLFSHMRFTMFFLMG